MSASSPTYTPHPANIEPAAEARPDVADHAHYKHPIPLAPDDTQILRVLCDGLRLNSTSGQEAEFVRFIESWANANGLITETFETQESALASYPQASLRHIPLRGRPTLLVSVPGRGSGPRLLFNAHADVVPAGDETAWRHPPFGGEVVGDRVYGRGASDAKGPLVSALWAMAAVARQGGGSGTQGGPVMLELVPGEEDCVGLGTLTSVAHGVQADGVVVLEPTECQPRCASRGGCRFEIVCRGRSVHGTVKWLGSDALRLLRRVLDALDALEERWNDRRADRRFTEYPIARPITVDEVQTVGGQGMVASEALCRGYLELLPGDERNTWKKRLNDELIAAVGRAAPDVAISFTEEYDGHALGEDSALYRAAAAVCAEAMPNVMGLPRLSGFNSGCEAGLRATLHRTPTLVWGPGRLTEAHAPDEYVSFDEVRHVAGQFVSLITRFSSGAPQA